MRRAALLAGLCAFLPAPAAAQQVSEVHLPTEADAIAVAVGAESIFFGPQGVETVLPGPVTDEEEVRVGLGLRGRVRTVVVDQRLVVRGLGDFQFKVAGPAQDVEALPASESEPGLRRGSVLWQGFSGGEKVLAARMPLFAEQEAERLPVAFDIAITVDGRPLAPGEPASGGLEARLHLHNVSAVPVSVATGDADPGDVAALADALRAELDAARRPVPGERGLPETVPVSGDPEHRVVDVEAPFRVAGRLSFPAGSVTGLRAEGGEAGADGVSFEVTLGGGRPLEAEVAILGTAEGLTVPILEASGEPALPDPSVLTPPGGGDWRDAEVEAAELLALASETLWRVARLRQFDAYLGNPDPAGPATTAYRFAFAEEGRAAAAPAPVAPVGPASVGGLLLLAALVLALLLGGVVAWSRA